MHGVAALDPHGLRERAGQNDLAGVERFLGELKAQHFLARSETMIALSTAVERGFTPAEV